MGLSRLVIAGEFEGGLAAPFRRLDASEDEADAEDNGKGKGHQEKEGLVVHKASLALLRLLDGINWRGSIGIGFPLSSSTLYSSI